MSGHVAVLASPGAADDPRRKRRPQRGASPPPPPMARRTSLTLASTVTAPRLPLSFVQRVGSSNPSPPASSSALLTTTPSASLPPIAVAAARPPTTTRRTSSRLASLAAASAATSNAAPPSDRKLPARRRQRTPAKVPRRPTNVGRRKDAEDTPKKKPAIAAESTVSPCCICMSECSQRAGLNSCPHEFCTPCIRQWSAQENSCPLCKQRFTHIMVMQSSNGKRRRIAVPHRNQRSDAGRVLDSLLQSLQQADGSIGIAIGVPWMVRGDGNHTAVHGGELEQFLRRFFVPTTGQSAATAIDMTLATEDDDDVVVTME